VRSPPAPALSTHCCQRTPLLPADGPDFAEALWDPKGCRGPVGYTGGEGPGVCARLRPRHFPGSQTQSQGHSAGGTPTQIRRWSPKAAGQKWRLDDAEGRCRYHQTGGQRSQGMGLSPLGGVRAGREKHCPFGEDAIGYIMYTEPGAMAVQITRRRVPVVGKNDHLSLFWVR
jgi:Lipocalin-like domain